MTHSVRHPIIDRAAVTVAQALGLPAGAVSIGIGERGEAANDGVIHARYLGDDSPKPVTNILLKINHPDFELMSMQEARTKLLAGLNTLKPISDIALTVPDEKTATALHAKLKAAAAGTSFDTRLLDWPGFNPEIAKKGWGVDDHALENVDAGPYGVEFGLRIPNDKKTDPKEIMGKLKENVIARLPAIREVLTARALKYVEKNMREGGKTAEEITAAVEKTKADMAKLEIHVNYQEEFGRSVRVTMRSPEQAAAIAALGGKMPHWGESPDNADLLRASNPLHQLTSSLSEAQLEANPDTSPQLQKALARAFLFAGDKAADQFSSLAGRKDMQAALGKELAKAIKGHPEKAPLLDEILQSNLFKNHHGWHQAEGAALQQPDFGKSAIHPGEVQVWITLPEEKLKSTIHGLAELAPTPSSILAAHKDTLAATQLAASQPNADMMSLATPESAAEASTAAAAPEHSSGLAGVLERFLPSGWVSRTKQAATSNSAQIG